MKNLENLSNFKAINNIGFTTHKSIACGGSDADRMCASLCPTHGCRHDGCCGTHFDWGGDSNERTSTSQIV